MERARFESRLPRGASSGDGPTEGRSGHLRPVATWTRTPCCLDHLTTLLGGKVTMRKQKKNKKFSILYNVLGFSVCSLGRSEWC